MPYTYTEEKAPKTEWVYNLNPFLSFFSFPSHFLKRKREGGRGEEEKEGGGREEGKEDREKEKVSRKRRGEGERGR